MPVTVLELNDTCKQLAIAYDLFLRILNKGSCTITLAYFFASRPAIVYFASLHITLEMFISWERRTLKTILKTSANIVSSYAFLSSILRYFLLFLFTHHIRDQMILDKVCHILTTHAKYYDLTLKNVQFASNLFVERRPHFKHVKLTIIVYNASWLTETTFLQYIQSRTSMNKSSLNYV